MNHMIDQDDGSHPMSPYHNPQPEKNHEHDPDERMDRLMMKRARMEDKSFLDEFTNEQLMEELESRFRKMGTLSFHECNTIAFLFKNLDRIQEEHLEWLTTNKQALR